LTATSNRVQRLRAHEGWNLLASAVETGDGARQLGVGSNPAVQACWLWDGEARDYAPLDPADGLAAGAVFWLNMASDQMLALSGKFAPTGGLAIAAGGDYAAVPGLAAAAADTVFPDPFSVWTYDAEAQIGQSRWPGALRPLSDAPDVSVAGPGVLCADARSGRGRAAGHEPERALLPPGPPGVFRRDRGRGRPTDGGNRVLPLRPSRHEYQPMDIDDEYGFTQKERDRESGLHYFGARYYHGALCDGSAPIPCSATRRGSTR